MSPRVGDRVRIKRDETCHPSKGTWPEFRGRTGVIVERNLGEYGVVFTETTWTPDKPRSGALTGLNVYWFQPHEVRPLAAESHTQPPNRPV